jgi:hypothetical protein
VFTARYALSPYIKQIRFVFKGLNLLYNSTVLLATGNKPEVSNEKNLVLLNAISPTVVRSHTVSDTDRSLMYKVQ